MQIERNWVSASIEIRVVRKRWFKKGWVVRLQGFPSRDAATSFLSAIFAAGEQAGLVSPGPFPVPEAPPMPGAPEQKGYL